MSPSCSVSRFRLKLARSAWPTLKRLRTGTAGLPGGEAWAAARGLVAEMSNGKGPLGPVFAFVHVPHTVPHSGAGTTLSSWHDGLANRTSMVDCGSTSAKDSAAVLRAHIEQGCNFVATQRPLWRLRSRIASALDDDDEGGTSPAVRLLSMAFLREPVSRGIATWQHYARMASESAPTSAAASTTAQWQAGAWRAKLPTPVSRFGLGALGNRSLCGAQGSLCWGDACGDLKLSSRGELQPQPPPRAAAAAAAERGGQAGGQGDYGGQGEQGEENEEQAFLEHCPSGPVFGNLQTFFFADPEEGPTSPQALATATTQTLTLTLTQPNPNPNPNLDPKPNPVPNPNPYRRSPRRASGSRSYTSSAWRSTWRRA